MNIFGLSITKALPTNLRPPDNRGGWYPIIREPFSGAWQQNVEWSTDEVLGYFAVYRCISLISSDIAKMRVKLVQEDAFGIWHEVSVPAFSPVLRKPNLYQTRIQFMQSWVQSKLINGNAYILKERDQRGVVIGLTVLDPWRVQPMVSTDGSVFYQLSPDRLAGLEFGITAPAREIIHDRWNTIFHPLVGTSPIFACGLAAAQGLKIQNNSASFFANGSNPGGILTAPGAISDETAVRLKQHWDTNYSGANVGKVAVLGDGLKYERMAVNAVDAQLIEQLKWTAEVVCAAFGVPAYMAGIGPAPVNTNIEALSQQYYSQCLQIHVESIEVCLDEGLALPDPYGTEFDTDGLLRMDTATLIAAEATAIGAGIKKPDESRKRLNLPPVEGGDTPYMQQQNFSLAALAKRDRDDPFAKPAPAPAAPAGQTETAPAQIGQADPEDEPEADPTVAARFAARLTRRLLQAAA